MTKTIDSQATIPPFNDEAARAAREYQLCLTKPDGSLGRLEELAVWYAGCRGQFPVAAPNNIQLVVFAADHGVVDEGVSAYPQAVTAAMVANFVAGGAAVNALAKASGVGVTVVDVGVAADLSHLPEAGAARFVSAKVRSGSSNLRRGPALSTADALAALAVGARIATESCAAGADILAAGEMGIGNTTSAAALTCAFTGAAPEDAVGRGTGIDDAGLARKLEVVRDAVKRHGGDHKEPLQSLAALGGLEIAAMAGLMIGGARVRVPTIVDGFISSAAALVACRLEPNVRPYLCFAHLSQERGHQLLLAALAARPLFDLGLRLGEGTGAVLAAQLVRAAVTAQAEMATFKSAEVPNKAPA